MTIPELMILICVVLTVIPVLVFLCVKWGTVGFQRGKEVLKKRNENVNSIQDESNYKIK